jgi:hypothetical protein
MPFDHPGNLLTSSTERHDAASGFDCRANAPQVVNLWSSMMYPSVGLRASASSVELDLPFPN